jgi:8-oxo-dGTP pyrophosphatase MutT (NUDIX family)
MKRKVLAYITRNNNTELLVFLHTHYPEAGLQVPAGTVGDNEDLIDALFREINEESGLSQLTLIRQLASEPFYAESKAEWQERNVFHLQAPDNLPESWLHIVSAGDEDKGLHFEYSWSSLSKAKATLSGGQGHWLDRIND